MFKKIKTFSAFSLTGVIGLTLTGGCSSSTNGAPQPKRVNMTSPTTWDYNKIRETREAEKNEKAQTPAADNAAASDE